MAALLREEGAQAYERTRAIGAKRRGRAELRLGFGVAAGGKEDVAELVTAEGARGIGGHGGSPEGFGVVPDPGLLPGRRAEAGEGQRDAGEGAGGHPAGDAGGVAGAEEPRDGAPRDRCRAQARQVAVAVVRELVAGVGHAAHGGEHHEGVRPRGEARGDAAAQGEEDGGEREDAGARPQEARVEEIDARGIS